MTHCNLPLMRLSRPRSLLCRRARGAWVGHGCVDDRPPSLVVRRAGFILPRLFSSSEFLHSSSRSFAELYLPSGSQPSSRHRRARPPVTRCVCPPASFHPQAFSTSRWFAPHSVGGLSAHCHVQGSLCSTEALLRPLDTGDRCSARASVRGGENCGVSACVFEENGHFAPPSAHSLRHV